MLYNVFDTEEDASVAQSYDYAKFIANHESSQQYVDTTTCWGKVQQRLDGKWIYPVCPDSDAVYFIEEYNPLWFLTAEELLEYQG